jgi:hypothetical protein
MSHFALRVGDLLHFHWFARIFYNAPRTVVRNTGPVSVVPVQCREAGVEEPACEDRPAVIDRLVPIESAVESLEGLDETILYLP